jgi:ABC-type Fe3+/spermidine/putrescine transport system ATPase subunit
MLIVTEIHKSFEGKKALDGVSFEVHPSEVLAVLGPSGCGKSTLLNIIAGLETPDQGDLTWEGLSLLKIPAYRRNFGLMFQDFALFPHKDVFENVAFGLQMAGLSKGEVKQNVEQALALVGLPEYQERDVNTLSGGEAQRVALARALAPRPRLLMLDEPLGSLDRTLRERLVLELRQILRQSRQTALYVTHDQQEAFILADRLVVMNAGKIVQTGTPETIYCQPANVFVARFLGLDNLFNGVIRSVNSERLVIDTTIGEFILPANTSAYEIGGSLTLLLRSDTVQVGAAGAHPLDCTLEEIVFRGSLLRATLNFQGTRLSFDLPNRSELPLPGNPMTISFNPLQALQIIDNE